MKVGYENWFNEKWFFGETESTTYELINVW